MKEIIFNGKKIQVPETVNGKELRDRLKIPQSRSIYVTDLDKKNHIVSDNGTLYVKEGMSVGDLPRTEKG